MVKRVIMCDLCYDKGESNHGIIEIPSNLRDLDFVNAHKHMHQQEWIRSGKTTITLQVSKINGTKPDPPSTRKGRPPTLKNSIFTAQPSNKPNPRPVQPRRSPSPPPTYTRVEKHCHDLLKARRQGRQTQCAVCGGWLTVVPRGDHIDIKYAMQHAYKYLGNQEYVCNVCKEKFESENAVKKHLLAKHSLTGSQNNFKVRVSKSEEEQIEMLTKCYGRTYEAKKDTQATVTQSRV